LATNPISLDNKDGGDWQTESFLGCRPKRWFALWSESAFAERNEMRVLVMYDPFERLDSRHPALVPREKHKVPFLGYALEGHAYSIGMWSEPLGLDHGTLKN